MTMKGVFRSLSFKMKQGEESTKLHKHKTAAKETKSEDEIEYDDDCLFEEQDRQEIEYDDDCLFPKDEEEHPQGCSNGHASMSSISSGCTGDDQGKGDKGMRRHSTMSTGVQFKRTSAIASSARRQSLTDITVKQDLGGFLIDDRESHTADMEEFQKFINQMKYIERHSDDTPYEPKVWDYIETQLSKHGISTGYEPQDNPAATVYKSKQEASAFMEKAFGLDPINPIKPHVVSESSGVPIDAVLTELLYATKAGLVSMKFAPECKRCGGEICEETTLTAFDSTKSLNCNMCNEPNQVHSLDKISVVFALHPSVLYVLASNFGCYPSKESMARTIFCAPVPATATGSGVRYSIGCDKDKSLTDEPLPKGRYRMHCPIAGVGCYLNIQENCGDEEEPLQVPLKVSDLLLSLDRSSTTSKTIDIKHGRVLFDVSPDTQSLYCLWVQTDMTDDDLYGLPHAERSPYTSAARLLHHPAFDRRFSDGALVDALAMSSELEVKHVVLMFTDVVGSTDMYASLGDLKALELVKQHYLVLFAAFSRYGRVIKTVGDSVMASFGTAAAAIEAAAEAILEVSKLCKRSDGEPFQIRIGIHSGPAVVVPLNGINDYFGQTVNKTARIESMAGSSSCLISEVTLQNDPDAMLVYENLKNNVHGETVFQLTSKETLDLKGIQKKTEVRGFQLTTPMRGWPFMQRRKSVPRRFSPNP